MALLGTGCWPASPRDHVWNAFVALDGVQEVGQAPDGGDWDAWLANGLLLTPAAAAPVDPVGTVTVRITLPEDPSIGWDGRSLAWPAGTGLWRLVSRDGRVQRVHGLTWDGRTRHAWFLGRTAPGAPLGAITWDLDGDVDPDAISRTLAFVLDELHLSHRHQSNERMAALLRELRCAGCHERGRDAVSRLMDEPHGMTAATDALGLYTPLALWTERVPVPAHGIRDPNVDDPDLRAVCPESPVHRVPDHDGDVRLRCSLGVVATYTRDTPSEATCATRRALAPHLDAHALAALAPVLQACGIDVPAQDGREEAVGAVPVGEGP